MSLYKGSLIFKFLADAIGIQVDYMNFFITQMTALLIAFLYRRFWTVDKVSYQSRLIGTLVPGVLLTIFCYGSDIGDLLLLTVLGYIATAYSPPKHVHQLVMAFAIVYLSRLHLNRMIIDYGSYVADITGPVMIAVQRVTSLAFSVHDGMYRDDIELSDEQRKYAVRRPPTILEYFSYIFAFQTVIAGPLIFYHDYIEFIEDSNFTKHLADNQEHPSPTFEVLKKFSIAMIFMAGLVFVTPLVPHLSMADESFINQNSIVALIIYMNICTTVQRFKYYFVWKLGEAICNQSGLGFEGFDENDNEKWDLASNIDIWGFEAALNFKGLLDSWNKTTQIWLRRCCYERLSSHRTLLTFVLSSIWHGFYPGYYMCFFMAGLATMAARTGRKCLRHHFQSSESYSKFYDVSTLIATRILIAYTAAPFVLLSFENGIKVHHSVYFFGHILCLINILVLPKVLKPLPSQRTLNAPNDKQQQLTTEK